MQKKDFITEEREIIEATLRPAQESIGDHVKYMEDIVAMAGKVAPIYEDYVKFASRIEIALMKIGIQASENKGAVSTDWLNHVWGLTYLEQGILLKKWGIPI